MIIKYAYRTDIIIASILHNVVEDTKCTTSIIEQEFSERVVEMVLKLTRGFKDYKSYYKKVFN